jgi:hypothetical protein
MSKAKVVPPLSEKDKSMLGMIQDGDVLLVHGRVNPLLNPMGYLTTQREGDTDLEHVFGVINGMAQTTGAHGLKFGQVPNRDYVRGKTISVLRYPGLTPLQISNMLVFYESIYGKNYNVPGYLHLVLKSFFPGPIAQLGRKPVLELPSYFCAQAEAARFAHANTLHPEKLEDGIIINPEAGKLDITAYAPSTFFDARNLSVVFLRHTFGGA